MWNMINNNFICGEKDLFRSYKVHLENLLHKKSDLDNKGPEIPFFLKNQLSKKGLIIIKESKINNDNYIINKKLKFMSNSPSPYSKYYNMPKYSQALAKQRFNSKLKERNISIHNENISFYKRFSKKNLCIH